jgi:DNA (cytosine-5)-methyltransferase 1
VIIPNHYSAKLSDLDMRMAVAVPPGGNWKNIPETIPSRRLDSIRESYRTGGGSRSTYYGRLRPNEPSYTINTYFGRPGNGCHLHYDYAGGQHRVISHREAARLQSFPDTFVFHGNRSAVSQQIGNAVPPLLAYQIAKTFPCQGMFIDLFCGAGGLALGFKWAGWQPIVANDTQASFLETYRSNVHNATILGDIRDTQVFDTIIASAYQARERHPDLPLFVLGGPPCQGFSTAGNRRTMEDDRNWLFAEFKAMLAAIAPAGFVFENVPGLLNMDGGRVFQHIRSELQATTASLVSWKLHTEEYAIPQRRARLILVGSDLAAPAPREPQRITRISRQRTLLDLDDLAPAITVFDALSDLPPLQSGEDGSHKDYNGEPTHPYQAFMRSKMTAEDYLNIVRNTVCTP